ncbi:HipA family kinase [uncultured Paludibaculum sp.]|uniref:HipA family kinase n=1 Tax=uncultured Paludibaculum sp. TaxID=1765020 RepID=UPI002AAA699B|nr:HipA family kinase [uncultured Paludibaculum sp.]
MPVNATRLERRMRGGAQAQLLACDDGRHYVTKFLENPQHRRILVNEWVAAVFLRHLQIASPEIRVVNLPPNLLEAESEICLHSGTSRRAVSAGWHFGSQFPGNPVTDAVYDYLPDALLASVVNVRHFLGALVFDKWTSNSDARQAIFFRRRIRDWLDEPSTPSLQKGFIAQMIDHGYIFDGPQWEFQDSPIQGLYFRPVVYSSVRGLDDFQPWLDRARFCPESLCDEVLRELPQAWLDQDGPLLESLLGRLMQRRSRIEDYLRATVRAKSHYFPAWR